MKEMVIENVDRFQFEAWMLVPFIVIFITGYSSYRLCKYWSDKHLEKALNKKYEYSRPRNIREF